MGRLYTIYKVFWLEDFGVRTKPVLGSFITLRLDQDISREFLQAMLQSPCPFVRPSVHTFVTDISASTGRNDFIFDDGFGMVTCTLSPLSRFTAHLLPVYSATQKFFLFAVMKTFVTVISASAGRNDFIFDIWLWHGDLYRVSPFQVYRTSTSCLACDLQMNEWGILSTTQRATSCLFQCNQKIHYLCYLA